MTAGACGTPVRREASGAGRAGGAVAHERVVLDLAIAQRAVAVHVAARRDALAATLAVGPGAFFFDADQGVDAALYVEGRGAVVEGLQAACDGDGDERGRGDREAGEGMGSAHRAQL